MLAEMLQVEAVGGVTLQPAKKFDLPRMIVLNLKSV